MSDRKDGGAAFPPNAGWRDNDADCRGMSLRDWFAGQALAGMLSADVQGSVPALAAEAYSIADALLAERSKP